METNANNTVNAWEFAEQHLIHFITLGIKCKKCGSTWGIRLNKETSLMESIRNIPPQRYICMECSKQLEKQQG
jgi:DNA-directed RNA polymerase subunit RPC12/RpoP